MKVLFLTFSCFFIFSFSDIQNEKIIYENYCQAIDSYGSTFPYYVVVNITDLNTGNSKEVCLEGGELVYALTNEWNINIEKDYKTAKKIKRRKNREFKIKTKNILNRVNRISYSNTELIKYSKIVNIDSISKSILKSDKWSFYHNSEKEQIMMAHLLFNKGILTGTNDCFGGEELTYINWKD